MPPSRTATRRTILVAVGTLVVGTAGVVAHPVSLAENDVIGEAASSQHSTATATTGESTSLLTRSELYATAVDAERNGSTASLYFVAEDGTWYHAQSDGTVGAPAPDGAVVPNIEDEIVDIPPSGRPVYVWKVTRDDCGTTVNDASDGRTISTFPIPGCDLPSPPSTTDSSATGEHDTHPTERDDSPTTGTAPGFGIGVSITALVIVAVLLLRQ